LADDVSEPTDRKQWFSVSEAIAFIAVLPAIVYGSGYLMWIVPSQRLFKTNLAPIISVSGLMEPGIIYACSLMLSIVFAYVVGSKKLLPFRRPARREWGILFELAIWFVFVFVASILGFLAVRRPLDFVSADPAGSTLYLVLHVVVIGFSFRRFYGLVRSKFIDPTRDRRRSSFVIRTAEGTLAVLLLYVQVPAAILFGSLGPNPVNRVCPITICIKGDSDGTSQGESISYRALFIERSSERFLVFDRESKKVIGWPVNCVLEVVWE